MFADDITISYSSKNISGLITKLNHDLHCVKQWLDYHKLKLNVIKTQVMIIGSRPNLKKISNNASEAPCFVTGYTNIDTVQNTKYLNVRSTSCLGGTCKIFADKFSSFSRIPETRQNISTDGNFTFNF